MNNGGFCLDASKQQFPVSLSIFLLFWPAAAWLWPTTSESAQRLLSVCHVIFLAVTSYRLHLGLKSETRARTKVGREADGQGSRRLVATTR